MRRIWTSTELNEYLQFPRVEQVFFIQRETTYLSSGKFTSETVHGVTSLSPEKADPARLLQLVRGHWSIENRLHWVRDVTFDEDRCRIRKGFGAQNMACLRNLAISMLRMIGIRYIPTGSRGCSRIGDLVLRLIGLEV